MKKSQTEIMGLAIIVVIIIFGVLLALIFFKPSQSIKADITDSTLASSMLTVIAETTLDCKQTELISLLQDCAENVENKQYCNAADTDACGKVIGIINESILQKTLEVWNKKYSFIAEVEGEDPFIVLTNTKIIDEEPACMFGSENYENIIYESNQYMLNTGDKMEISISICK